MVSENPNGCIYPKCKCRFRCKDLFGADTVIEVEAGVCPTCCISTTVYKFGADFFCKNCIANMKTIQDAFVIENKKAINADVSFI